MVLKLAHHWLAKGLPDQGIKLAKISNKNTNQTIS